MTRLADLSLEVCFGTLALLRVHRTRFRNVSRGIASSLSDDPRPSSAQRSTRRGDCAWTTENPPSPTNSMKRSALKQCRSSGTFDVSPFPFKPERSDIVRMTAEKSGKIALLWRGDRQARRGATAQNNRTIGFSRRWQRSASRQSPRSTPRSWRMKCGRSFSVATGCWSGSTRFRMDESNSARCAVARRRLARRVGERSPRRDPENGREGSPSPHQSISAGARTPICIVPPEPFATSFCRGFERRVPACSSRTAAMAGRACGRSNCSTPMRPFGFCTPAAAACRRPCHQAISCELRSLFRRTRDASSISRFSRGCPTA